MSDTTTQVHSLVDMIDNRTPGSRLRLGLDIGIASVGWALLEIDANGDPIRFLGMGSRIFDAFETRESKRGTVVRRTKRSLRRQIRRTVARKESLRKALIQLDLFPADELEAQREFDKDPWLLRARGLTEQLTPYELGRVLLHISDRRGFMSNRLEKADKDDSTKPVLDESNDAESEFVDDLDTPQDLDGLDEDINLEQAEKDAAGFDESLTVGQRGAARLAAFDPKSTAPRPIRRAEVRPPRQAIEDEMLRIWAKQQEFHPLLSDEAILFGKQGRREYPLDRTKRVGGPRVTRGLNGDQLGGVTRTGSMFEEVGLHGLLFFQEKFWWDPATIGYCTLLGKPHLRAQTADRRFQLFRILKVVNEATILNLVDRTTAPLDNNQRASLIARLMDKKEIKRSDLYGFFDLDETRYSLSLERGPSDVLKGHETDALLRPIFGASTWKQVDDTTKTDLADAVMNEDLSDEQFEKVIGALDLEVTPEQMIKLHKVAVKFPAGRAQYCPQAIDRLLPHLLQGMTEQKAKEAESLMHQSGTDRFTGEKYLPLPDLDDIRNPFVVRAISQVRKVVNELIRTHGVIDEMVVETTKEMNMSAKKKKEHDKLQATREKERTALANDFRSEHDGRDPKGQELQRLQLWKQQGEICLYTGKPISKAQALDGNITDIDHIAPQWRSLDNSLGNKTLCFAKANAEKGDRTPYEWLSSDVDKWADFVARAVKYGGSKTRRLVSEESPEERGGYAGSAIGSTGHISREVRAYLQIICPDPRVKTVNGSITSVIRRQLNLEELKYDADRARTDHRNHALDAAMICFATPAVIKAVAEKIKLKERNVETAKSDIALAKYMPLREQIATMYENIVVSRAPKRKLTSGFHAETQLSMRKDKEGNEIATKMIDTAALFDPKAKKADVDKVIGRIINEDAKQRLTQGIRVWEDGSPIKRVRIKPKDQKVVRIATKDGREIAYGTGDIAYVEIHPTEKGFAKQLVSYFDLGRGSVRSSTFCLFKGDIVRLGVADGPLWVIKKFSEKQFPVELLEWAASDKSTKYTEPAWNTVLKQRLEKVNVSPAGVVTTEWVINDPKDE